MIITLFDNNLQCADIEVPDTFPIPNKKDTIRTNKLGGEIEEYKVISRTFVFKDNINSILLEVENIE